MDYRDDSVHSYKRRRGESFDSWQQRQRATNSAAVNQVSWRPTDGNRGARPTVQPGTRSPRTNKPFPF
jgi:hypothetical protein